MQKEVLRIKTEIFDTDIDFRDGIDIYEYSYTANRMEEAALSATFYHNEDLSQYWTKKEFVKFQGNVYYIVDTPTITKSGKDARYKYEVKFVDDTNTLKGIDMYDVAVPPEDDPNNRFEQYFSNTTNILYEGDIQTFVARFNASLKYALNGATRMWRMELLPNTRSEIKTISMNNVKAYDALKYMFQTYDIPYKIENRVIYVGNIYNFVPYVFKYGKGNGIYELTKSSASNEIITRITGTGGTENIPYYYPNESDERGNEWIPPQANLMPSIYRSSKGANRYYIADETESIYSPPNTPKVEITKTINNTQPFIINTIPYGITVPNDLYSIKIAPIRIEIESFGQTKNSMMSYDIYITSTLDIDSRSYLIDKQEYSTYDIPKKNIYIPTTTINTTRAGRYFIYISFNIPQTFSGYYVIVKTLIEGGINQLVAVTNIVNINNPNSPVDGIVEFPDIKPTIQGMKYNNIAIDEIKSVEYDVDDNDKLKDDGSNEYQHPKFNVTLNPLGFNIFDSTSETGAMTIAMKSGKCAGAQFKVISDENNKPLTPNRVTIYSNFPYIIGIFQLVGSGISKSYDSYGITLPDNSYTLQTPIYRLTFSTKNTNINTIIANYGIYIGIEGNNKKYTVQKGSTIIKVGRLDASSGVQAQPYIEIPYKNTKVSTSGLHYIYIEISTKIENTSSYDDKAEIIFIAGGDMKSQLVGVGYPNSTNVSVPITLLKDIDTFGTILPNQQLKVAAGDKFVILNINFPQSYILNAEQKLTEAIIKHLNENNFERFNFSIKFSSIFFAQNPNIINKINENSIIRIGYSNKITDLYVDSINITSNNDNPLYDYNIQVSEKSTKKNSKFYGTIKNINDKLNQNTGTLNQYVDAITSLNNTNNKNVISLGKLSDTAIEATATSSQAISNSNNAIDSVKPLSWNNITSNSTSNILMNKVESNTSLIINTNTASSAEIRIFKGDNIKEQTEIKINIASSVPNIKRNIFYENVRVLDDLRDPMMLQSDGMYNGCIITISNLKESSALNQISIQYTKNGKIIDFNVNKNMIENAVTLIADGPLNKFVTSPKRSTIYELQTSPTFLNYTHNIRNVKKGIQLLFRIPDFLVCYSNQVSTRFTITFDDKQTFILNNGSLKVGTVYVSEVMAVYNGVFWEFNYETRKIPGVVGEYGCNGNYETISISNGK